jgi:hypothetical protein
MKNNLPKNGEMVSLVADADKIKALKQKKQKKASVSLRPLQFEPSDEDTPLKAEIIRRINKKNLVYSDLYAYCTKIKNGDVSEGQKLGYNIISGLKNRHSMIDSTVSLLADFLELDIYFVDRNSSDDDEGDVDDVFDGIE